jgi:NAD-dependent DNA ligase
MNSEEIKSKIKQRRAQMLVHSCLYYELNENIVDDHTWQKWADELEVLQREHPEECNIKFFDYEFRDWDGSTGNHLNHRHPWTYDKAKKLLEYHKRFGQKSGLEKFL